MYERATLLAAIEKYARKAGSGGKTIVRVNSLLKNIIPGFVRNMEKNTGMIWESLDKEDYEAIRVMSHGMKGAGGGYGLDAITGIGGSLEQAARDGDSEEIRRLNHKLGNFLERLEVVYDD